MKRDNKKMVLRYAAILWLLAVMVCFVLSYGVSCLLLYWLGLPGNQLQTIALGVGSVIGIVSYIGIGIWGLRYL